MQLRATRWAAFLGLVIATALGGCGPETRPAQPVIALADPAAPAIWLPEAGQPIRWKAILVGGDNAEAAFANSAEALARMLRQAGLPDGDIAVLSAYERDLGKSADAASIAARLQQAKIGPGDGCLVMISAHGTQAGLHMRGSNSYYALSPAMLNDLLRQHCRQAPTVVIASACYSGVFAQAPMPAPNRVIYTAARRDRPSFGCNAQLEFTYFDYCLLSSLPEIAGWPQLAKRSAACVRDRETKNRTGFSEPQFVLGDAMRDVSPPAVPFAAMAAMWQVVPPQLAQANTLPFGGQDGKRGLEGYKQAKGAKAVAVGPGGGWAWRGEQGSDDAASAAALAACRESAGRPCLLYAVGDRLVWHDSVRQTILSGRDGQRLLVQAD